MRDVYNQDVSFHPSSIPLNQDPLLTCLLHANLGCRSIHPLLWNLFARTMRAVTMKRRATRFEVPFGDQLIANASAKPLSEAPVVAGYRFLISSRRLLPTIFIFLFSCSLGSRSVFTRSLHCHLTIIICKIFPYRQPFPAW